jgi:hypothetical protein
MKGILTQDRNHFVFCRFIKDINVDRTDILASSIKLNQTAYFLGSYESEERAREVYYDLISELVEPNTVQYIYKMPKE